MTATAWRRRAVDTAFAVVCAVLALLGFGTIFAGHDYLLVGLAGIGAALVTTALSARLPVLVTVGIAVVVYVWLGVILVFGHDTVFGALPSLRGIAAVGHASAHGWRDIVTTLPPVVGRDLLTIPYLIGLAGTLVGLQISWRTNAVLLPLIGPAAMLAAVILLGTDVSASVLACGAAFALIGLSWGAVRQRRSAPAAMPVPAGLGAHRPVGARRSTIRAVAVLGAVAAVTVLISLTQLGTGSPRYVLRDHVQPPFDVSAYPSPLSSYRKYEVTDKDTVLFTVSGVPDGARIRLAVMDSYDGVVWGVAGGPGSTQASGVFQRVGDPIPVDGSGQAATVTVTAGALGGVWMPTVGAVRTVRFAGPRASDLTESFRYNLTTGVGVVPATLTASDRYTMSVIVPKVPDIATLRDNASGSATLPDLHGVADQVASKADAWTQGIGAPVQRLQALIAQLRNGAFSDGSLDSSVVSPPGAGEHRIQTFLSAPQLVGDGEQYAATLALMARNLGIPARVVVGIVPPASGFDGRVTGAMVSAWVEVDIDGAGWVPLDPTPPVTNLPKPQETEQQPNVFTRVIAPPIVEAQATDEEPANDPGTNPPPPPGKLSLWLGRLLAIGEYGGFEVLGIGALLFGIVLAKRRRRARRRTTGTPLDQITAAWTELLERLRDLGITAPSRGTRRQGASAAGFPQVEWIAERVDRAVFAPGDPDAETAVAVWADVEALVGRLGSTRTRLRRFRAAVDPTCLRPPKPPWMRLPDLDTALTRIPKLPTPRLPGLGERS